MTQASATSIIVAPSLLSADFLNLERDISILSGASSTWLHLDIMDGHFVPNLTFGNPIIELISKKTTIPLDAHFMVTNPDFYLETFRSYNIHNFTFHYEALGSEKKIIEFIKEAKKIYPSTGISIKPKTPISKLTLSILSMVDLVLVMSVEPGFGGQKFIDSTWERLNELQQIRVQNELSFSIQIDGGISDQNAKRLIEYGVNNLVAGSFVFNDGPEKYLQNIELLRS